MGSKLVNNIEKSTCTFEPPRKGKATGELASGSRADHHLPGHDKFRMLDWHKAEMRMILGQATLYHKEMLQSCSLRSSWSLKRFLFQKSRYFGFHFQADLHEPGDLTAQFPVGRKKKRRDIIDENTKGAYSTKNIWIPVKKNQTTLLWEVGESTCWASRQWRYFFGKHLYYKDYVLHSA